MKVRSRNPFSPRNSLVITERFRRAGAHGARGKAVRQRARLALRQEMKALAECP